MDERRGIVRQSIDVHFSKMLMLPVGWNRGNDKKENMKTLLSRFSAPVADLIASKVKGRFLDQ